MNATLGFGRTHVAALISTFAKRHPEVDVQLQLSTRVRAFVDALAEGLARPVAPSPSPSPSD